MDSSFQEKNENHSFLWDDGKLTLVNVIRNYSDVFNQNRYTRDGFNAEVFELAHVLLWSRISLETYNQLINCFTTNTVSSTVDQLSARDKDGKMTDQWVSGIVDTVGTSVYYSYKVVVKNRKLSENSEQFLLMLIKSAIKGTTEFLMCMDLIQALHPGSNMFGKSW